MGGPYKMIMRVSCQIMIVLVQAFILNDTKVATFGTNFAVEITFDVAISTSEAMQFHAESLVIVKNRI